MEFLPKWALGYVRCFIVWLRFKDEPLDILPSQVFFGITCLFCILGLLELHEEDSDEEVQEEEGYEEDDSNERTQEPI